MLQISVCAMIWLLLLVPYITSVRVQCNHPEKIREDHIHYCCRHPDGHNNITEECAQQTGFKLPSPQEEAIEDVTVEQVIRGLCWGECVFNRFGFLNKHNQLDMDAVRRYYGSTHPEDPEYMREMIDAYDHCHGKAEDLTANFIVTLGAFSRKAKHCQPMPSVVLSCVIYKFFHNCPKDRWAHTQECTDTLNFSKRCKDALTTM